MIKMPSYINRVNLSRDIHINPLEFLEMIFYVENEFNIELPDNDLQKIQTVGDLVQCVQKYSSH